MSTQHADIFRALAEPFGRDEIKNCKGPGGRRVEFVTARTKMNRLDDVLGPENWWDDYIPQKDSVICRLTIRLPDGRTVTKVDAGGHAGMQDQGDDEKSAVSDAFKRAAVKFGIGRQLYGDGCARFPEAGPAAPVANESRTSPAPEAATTRTPPADAGSLATPPKAGQPSAFWWFKNVGDHFNVSIVPKIEEIAQQEGLGRDFKVWDEATLARMVRRTVDYCRRLPTYKGELDALAEPAEPRDPSPVNGARSALFARASMLWTATYPGTPFTEADILDMVKQLSNDRIPDLNACADIDLIREVGETMRKLLAEKSGKTR